MFQRILAAFLLALCASCALAEPSAYPLLDDPVDRAVQQLSALSQQDAVFQGVPYDDGYLTGRGCGPVAFANALIATFRITDKDVAAGLVLEMMDVMTPGGDWKRRRIDQAYQPRLFDREMLASGLYPNLTASIGAYPGTIYPDAEVYTAEETLRRVDQAARPSVLTSRTYVNASFETVVRILLELHRRGMDDATLCIARGEAGTKRSTMPLRSGKSGHYLTLLFHVGSFIRDGSVYVLDSLPRALEGEAVGGDLLYHSRYPFVTDNPKNDFNSRYTASRIHPSIIRLSLRPGEIAKLDALAAQGDQTPEALHEALVAQRTRQLAPLILYGSCTMFLRLPAET